MSYRRVGVIGAGVIGVGVAQSLAQTGHLVVLVDISEDILDRARRHIGKDLKFAALFDAKVREANHSEILSRIQLTTEYGRLHKVDIGVENTTESWSVKQSIYPRLDQLSVVFSTTMSTLFKRPYSVVNSMRDSISEWLASRTLASNRAAN